MKAKLYMEVIVDIPEVEDIQQLDDLAPIIHKQQKDSMAIVCCHSLAECGPLTIVKDPIILAYRQISEEC